MAGAPAPFLIGLLFLLFSLKLALRVWWHSVSPFMYVMLLSLCVVAFFIIIPQFVIMSFMRCSVIDDLIEGVVTYHVISLGALSHSM